AVVGLGTITSEVSNGDIVIIDGSTGTVIIDPDEKMLERYRIMQRSFEEFERQLTYLARLPTETVDGYRVKLYANVEFQEELRAALDVGADGIGLYRTEFLFLDRDNPPNEEEQFRIYREAARMMDGRPVVIRTLDLGADKMPSNGIQREANPFLGCRSIRYTLICRPDLLKTQLLAILRASVYGDVRLMLPMVTTVDEVRRAKAMLQDAMEQLRQRREPFNPHIQLGVMIEVPSAAMAADLLAPEVDFFSIGTNDLIQYTLAVDRGNPNVAQLYQPTHPAVLRLIKNTIDVGRKHGIPVAMCGEMSGDVVYVPLLLGFGLELFSAAPPNILEVKKVIRSLTIRETEELAKKVLAANDTLAAETILREKAHRIVPQLV
ncbi:MAG: phosphoenolpyruvate--protein phosphotransferase, partial [Planctomycetota bacterium]